MRDIVHYISGKSVKGAGTRFGDVFDPQGFSPAAEVDQALNVSPAAALRASSGATGRPYFSRPAATVSSPM